MTDIYDALTTARPYKPAYSPDEAFRTLEEESRRGWRDIELVSLFSERFFHGYAGSPDPGACGVPLTTPITFSLENMRREVSR